MKKEYEKPETEFIRFEYKDVCLASPQSDIGGGEADGPIDYDGQNSIP